MSYNNFDENRPNQNNGILTDINSINEALNILREQGLSTNFPTNTTAGMPFARLEARDDNALQNKIVVYRRNADDDDWLKVYDEEYGVDADLYKGNDIDSDGDGKVDSAEEADSATFAYTAESANKINNQLLGQERFQVSGNSDESITINAGEFKAFQRIFVTVPQGRWLVVKRARFQCYGSSDFRLRISASTDYYTSSSSAGEETPNYLIEDEIDSGNTGEVKIGIYNPTDSDIITLDGSGWWVDFSIE